MWNKLLSKYPWLWWVDLVAFIFVALLMTGVIVFIFLEENSADYHYEVPN